MIVPTRRIGTFFNVAQFIVINLVIILIYLSHSPTEARKQMPLLIDDDTQNRMRPECLFGKTLRELGSTWYADLGPPFGVMYCIKCECVPVTKRRRIVARVQCRNIKNECPKLDCDEPVQLPGKCCKVCPGKTYDLDLVQDVPVQQTQEEEEKNMKHFGALLTTRTSYFLKHEQIKTPYATNNPSNIIATGRFTFHKKNLYFSFYVSERAARPRLIQFIDETGHILEEIILIQSSNIFSVYQNATSKVCGVWRRVPRDYRRLLRDENMNVVLMWGGKSQPELALAGKISKYPALSTELFTSLLEAPFDQNGTINDELKGAGGTAIVSTSSGATSSIHLTLVLNGLFHDEITDVPLNVRLEMADKEQKILQDTVIVKKTNYDYNIIEFSSPVSTHDLRLLTRGKLNLIVESRKRPDKTRIQGPIMTRAACEIYHTVLAPTSTESKTKSSGLAWVFVNRDGQLVYNIHTDDLNLQENPLITLVDDSVKRKIDYLEDLTPSLSFDEAVGVLRLDKMGPRILDPLYANNLAINVATENEQNLIRGRLIGKQLADARDSKDPILLKRLDPNAPAHLVGMAWMAVDNDCTLHYEITLNSYNAQQGLELYLEEKPLEAPNAPVTTKILDEFNGEYLEGFLMGMSAYELSKLAKNVCYLQVKAKESGTHLLKGKLRPIKIPNQCIMPGIDSTQAQSELSPNDHTDNNVPLDPKCYHSGRFYDEGEQWQNGMETCSMCACVYGRVKCDKLECPPLKCKESESRLPRKDECCPSCPLPKELNVTANVPRGCRLGDQFHSAGSSWYPYLPPNGFDRCAICTCNATTLEVKCPRVQCPALSCSEKVAYRPNKTACCRVCPEVKESHKKAHDPELMGDQGSKRGTIKSPDEILAHGGCKIASTVHENGDEWHPVLPSHGEQKCITCRCKDSVIKCDRKRCVRSACNKNNAARNRVNGFSPAHTLHDVSGISNAGDSDDCCSAQCRRARRHHNQKHRMHREKGEKLQKSPKS